MRFKYKETTLVLIFFLGFNEYYRWLTRNLRIWTFFSRNLYFTNIFVILNLLLDSKFTFWPLIVSISDDDSNQNDINNNEGC